MEKPTIIQTPHQAEDGALKVLHDYFAHVLLPYWKIPGGIEHPVTEFTSGINTYRIHPIIMKGKRAEDVFKSIEDKLEQALPLTENDLVPLTLCPLMGGDIPQRERFHRAFEIVRGTADTIPNLEIIEAVLYTMATKFLTTEELDNLKEGIKMTELGTMIYNDGVADGIAQGISQGIEKDALENARNFFINGVSFEIVRDSIKALSEDRLREIYDEVMASKEG